jgi:hypothetical protein
MILLILIGRIDSFHTHVETYDKIVEIEAKTQSIANSNLLPKLRYLELTSRLVFVITKCPDITSVDKQSATKLPKQAGAIL